MRGGGTRCAICSKPSLQRRRPRVCRGTARSVTAIAYSVARCPRLAPHIARPSTPPRTGEQGTLSNARIRLHVDSHINHTLSRQTHSWVQSVGAGIGCYVDATAPEFSSLRLQSSTGCTKPANNVRPGKAIQGWMLKSHSVDQTQSF